MDNKLTKFLEKIKMIESSGGIDTDHREMKEGIHKGHSAYGSYGLMPNTIQEIVNRARIEKGLMSPEYQEIHQKDPDTVKALLSEKPELEEKLARDLAIRLLKRMPDEERAAYGWNMGHNLSPDRITKEKLNAHPYIQKFRNLRHKLGMK